MRVRARGYGSASQSRSFGMVHALTPRGATDYKRMGCVFSQRREDGNNMSFPRSITNLLNASQRQLLASLKQPASGFHHERRFLRLSPKHARDAKFFNSGKLAVLLARDGHWLPLNSNDLSERDRQKGPLQLFFRTQFRLDCSRTAICELGQSKQAGAGELPTKRAISNGGDPNSLTMFGSPDNLLLTGS